MFHLINPTLLIMISCAILTPNPVSADVDDITVSKSSKWTKCVLAELPPNVASSNSLTSRTWSVCDIKANLPANWVSMTCTRSNKELNDTCNQYFKDNFRTPRIDPPNAFFKLFLQFDYLAPHGNISLTEQCTFSIVLDKIKDERNNDFLTKTLLFNNMSQVKRKSLTILDSFLTNDMILWIARSFYTVENITISRSEFKQIIEPDIFSRFRGVQSISITDSSFIGIQNKGFEVGGPIQKFEMINNKFIDSALIASNAFFMTNPCNNFASKSLIFTIKNSGLSPKTVDANFFSGTSKWPQNCPKKFNDSEKFHLSISILDNMFENLIPEAPFKKLLDDVESRKWLSLHLRFDKIDCCLETNKWLFDSMYKHNMVASPPAEKQKMIVSTMRQPKNLRINVDMNCNDLGSTASEQAPNLKQACYDINQYPIIIVAIIAILLLATVLGLFSFLCIFYVLPKKGQVINLSTSNSSEVGSAPKQTSVATSNDIVGAKTLPNVTSPIMENHVKTVDSKADEAHKMVSTKSPPRSSAIKASSSAGKKAAKKALKLPMVHGLKTPVKGSKKGSAHKHKGVKKSSKAGSKNGQKRPSLKTASAVMKAKVVRDMKLVLPEVLDPKIVSRPSSSPIESAVKQQAGNAAFKQIGVDPMSEAFLPSSVPNTSQISNDDNMSLALKTVN